MKHLNVEMNGLIVGEKYVPSIQSGDGVIDMKGWDGVATDPNQNINIAGNGINRMKMDIVSQAFSGLLIHSNDADQSEIFADTSASTHSILNVNNVKHVTSNSKFGASAMEFISASNTLLRVSDHTDFHLSGSATIDFWINMPTPATRQSIFSNLGSNDGWRIETQNSRLMFYAGGSLVQCATTLIPNTWTHFAVVIDSINNTVKVYLDGILQSTKINAVIFKNASEDLVLGGSPSTSQFTGLLDEVRFIKDKVEWTENFTPPQSPYIT